MRARTLLTLGLALGLIVAALVLMLAPAVRGNALSLAPSAEPVSCAADYPVAYYPVTHEVVNYPSWWCDYPPDAGPCADGQYVLPDMARMPHLTIIADLRRRMRAALQDVALQLMRDGNYVAGDYLWRYMSVLDDWGIAYEYAMGDRCAGRR